MATTLAHFGAHHFGGGPPDGVQLSASFSALSAGDWITVGCAGIDGDGLAEPVVSDNIGGSYHKIADFTSSEGADSFRYTVWRKKALGGENALTALWPGSSNKSMVGYTWAGPTQPDVYVISQGEATWDGSARVFVIGSAPNTNAESYVSLCAQGRVTPPGVGMSNPTATSGQGEELAGCVQTYGLGNADEGSNNTGDAITVTNGGGDHPFYVVVLGIDTSNDVEIDGVGELLIGGEVEVTAPVPPADVAGVGRILIGGDVAVETTGGDENITGTGRLLIGGSTGLDAPVPSPPIPERAIANVVGCGVYEILAFTRGGGEVVGSLEFADVAWGRALDATSAATMTIDGVSNLGALERCCELVGSLNPWEHELAIYRQVPGSQQKQRVWMGPITRMRFPNESVVIEALDLSGWLQRRTLHANHNFVNIDLIEMWVAWVEDAMSVDNSPGLFPHVLALSGILADRLTTIVEHNYASDPIAEIATTGIDWTVIDRVMQAGPVLPQPDFDAVDSLPLLLDEAFRVAPEIIVDGMAMGDCWLVNAGFSISGTPGTGEYGPHFPATPDHVEQPAAPDYAAIEAQFGRLEQVVSETRILDQPSVDDNAKTRYELTKRPVAYIAGGELLPTAPLPINQIVPGALLRVKLNRACKPVDAVMRIQQLTVTANSDGSESVDIGLEPIGTIANG